MFRAFPPPFNGPVECELSTDEEEEIPVLESGDVDGLVEYQRAAKRRRIEEKANGYLAGDAPFIFTATLRGPFENGWVNPWTKKKTEKIIEDSRIDDIVVDPPTNPSPAPEEGRFDFKSNGLTTHNVENGLELEEDRIEEDTVLPHEQQGPGHLQMVTAHRGARSSPLRDKDDWLKTTKEEGSKSRARVPMSVSPSPAPKYGQSHKRREKSHYDVAGHRPGPLSKPLQEEYPSAMPATGVRRGRRPKKAVNPGAHFRLDVVKTAGFAKSKVQPNSSPKPVLLEAEQDHDVMRNPGVNQEQTKKDRHQLNEDLGQQNEDVPIVPADTNRQRRPEVRVDTARSRKVRIKKGKQQQDQKNKPTSNDVPQLLSYEISTDYVSVSSRSSRNSSSVVQVSASVEDDGPGHTTAINATPPSIPHETRNRSKAVATAARRLTFTPNGGSQLHDSRPSSQSDQKAPPPKAQQSRQPAPRRESKSTKTSSRSSQKALSNGQISKESTTVQPEAQVKEDPPPLPAAITRSSTNLLETDKQPVPSPLFDEEDSYMILGTQAAMDKARQRFHDDVLAGFAEDEREPTSKKRDTPKTVTKDVGPSYRTPRHQDLLSTQAMMDELSPFDMSTIKKRPPTKRTSHHETSNRSSHGLPSPTRQTPFPTFSPNMSTSASSAIASRKSSVSSKDKGSNDDTTPREPAAYATGPSLHKNRSRIVSHAHPEPTRSKRVDTPPPATLSPLDSFSINPDGTLTESRPYQDGQQPVPALVPEDSYATLPSLDFTRPLSSKTSSDTTTSHRERRRSTTSNGASPHATPTNSPPQVLDTASASTKPSTENTAGNQSSASGEYAGVDAKEFLIPTNISEVDSANTPDKEVDDFLEVASSFLAEWNVDKEAKKKPQTPSKKAKLDGGRRIDAAAKPRSIMSKRKVK